MDISVWLEVAFSIDLSVNMGISYAIWSIEYLECVRTDRSLESIFSQPSSKKQLHTKNLSDHDPRGFLIILSHILQFPICTKREDIWRWLITESPIETINSWKTWYHFREGLWFTLSWEIRWSEPEWIAQFISDIYWDTRTRHTEWDMSILLSIEIFWEYNSFFFAQDNAPWMRIILEEPYLIPRDLAIFA